MYFAEDALVESARKAGSFMVTLVEQGLINTRTLWTQLVKE